MKNDIKIKFSALVVLFIYVNVFAQAPTFNQNSARSNHAATVLANNSWRFGINTAFSSGLKMNENSLFRGSGFSTKMAADYFIGHFGLGFSTGMITGSLDDNTVNKFVLEQNFKTEQITQTHANPFNSYLFFGPSFQFGKKVVITGAFQTGVFLSNPGSLIIGGLQANGVTGTFYRFDRGTKDIFLGFSESINILYPINPTTHFFLSSEFIQSQTSVKIYDPQNRINTPTDQNRNTRLFNIGVGISKTFSFKNNPISHRVLPTINKKGIGIDDFGMHSYETNVSRDTATGRDSGKSSGQFNPKEYNLDKRYRPGRPTFGNRTAESCGSVTIKETHPDGTTVEKTFACPEDALTYENPSNPDNKSKQTQAATFGEKVNQGFSQAGGALANGASLLGREGIVYRDLAARNILVGRICFNNQNPSGIVTNTSAVSSVSTLGGGASSGAYAATGKMASIASDIYVREESSGNARGKSCELVYSDEQGGTIKTQGKMTTIKNNPIYKENTNSGTNLLYEGKSNQGASNDCDGVAGLNVCLIEVGSRTTVARTLSEACGEFYFANVPSGDYVVQITGSYLSKKGYDAYISHKSDVAGVVKIANNYWSIDYTMATGSEEDARALVKSKTKSNQSNDKMSGNGTGTSVEPQKASINTTRSNIKHLTVAVGDVDGDGYTDLAVGTSLVGGTLPGGAVISALASPGSPIGGLSIKGGKNPGGNSRTVPTNANGEFVFTDWKEGNYTISTEITNYINDETIVSFDGDVTSADESRLKGGVVKITASQNSQSLKAGINNSNNLADEEISFDETRLKGGGVKVTATQNSQSLKSGINNSNSLADEEMSSDETRLKGGVIKVSASQNSQTLKSGINNINSGGMPNRISMNVTVPKQTQRTDFGEKSIDSDPSALEETTPNQKARNNNTVRSNRSDNALLTVDIDGDGTVDSSYLNFNGEIATIRITKPGMDFAESTNVAGGISITESDTPKKATNVGPVKWMAPEVISKRVWGDPHKDENSGALKLGNGNFGTIYSGKWQGQDATIKAIRCSDGVVLALTGKGNDYPAESRISINSLPLVKPVSKASFVFVASNGKTYKKETDSNGSLSLKGLPSGVSLQMVANFGVDGNDDILITFNTNAQGKAISNVLKTKHETAKNSIGNIR